MEVDEGFQQSPKPTKANAEENEGGPNTFLNEMLNEVIYVKLNSGAVYKGILQAVDGYMNIALDQCKDITGDVVQEDIGDAFIRGNNVAYIASWDGRYYGPGDDVEVS